MTADHIEFKRSFKLWAYAVSHAQLLIRSPKYEGWQTRVDILFKDVAAIDLPTAFEGLSIYQASDEKRRTWASRLGNLTLTGRQVYEIRGLNFIGHLVSGKFFWHEDTGEAFEPSHFDFSIGSPEVKIQPRN